VIFDWDDTLFPTSAFLLDEQDDFKRVKKGYKKLFEELDGVVKDLIQMALNDNNKVALVTNASLEWVYQSS
jgi:hypothetical protein